MKTNQLMEVKINQDCVIRIGHKTKLGKVDEILAYGNWKREQRGLRPIELREILRKQEFWEFVIARNTQSHRKMIENKDENLTGVTPVRDLKSVDSDYSLLEEYKDRQRRIDYVKLSKQFPNLIKIQRGGKPENRGYWFDLYILLKIASMLDKDLEVQIYDIFISGKILELRDSGGEAFKRLNILIDTLEDLPKQPDRYVKIAKLVNKKANNGNLKLGWNNKGASEQEVRDDMIKQLESFIKVGFIKSYEELINTIERM